MVVTIMMFLAGLLLLAAIGTAYDAHRASSANKEAMNAVAVFTLMLSVVTILITIL